MNIQRTIIGLAFFLATSICATALAQTGDKRAGGKANVTSVVSLHHVDSATVEDAIKSLGYDVRSTVAGDRKIIMHGKPEIVRQIQSELIAEIDIAGAQDMADDRDTHIFALDQQPSEEFVGLLRAVTNGRSTRIAFDGRNRLIVVGGPPSDIDAVKEIIASATKPRSPLTVSLFFIRGQISSEETGEDKLPKPLAGVGRALRASGFSDLSLLAPVVVTVDQGGQFEHHAALQGSSGNGHRNELVFGVEGTAQLSKHGETIQIAINAEVHGEYYLPKNDTQARTMFEANTTVAANLGEYIVLAASPASTANGTAIALAISVLRH